MELAPAGVTCSFEVTFDSGELNVAMSVYDTTTGSAILISGPTAMINIPGTNTYWKSFTPTVQRSYIIFKAVYTDDTFETLDTDYSQGSESIIAEDIGASPSGNSGGCNIVGLVIPNDPIVGLVVC